MSIKQMKAKLYSTLKSQGWPEPTKEHLLTILSNDDLNRLEGIGVIEPDIRNPKGYFINWKVEEPEELTLQTLDDHISELERRLSKMEEKINDIYELFLRNEIKKNIEKL